jgi:hypothetical protein
MNGQGITRARWHRVSHLLASYPAWWRLTASDRQWLTAWVMVAGLVASIGILAWRWQVLPLSEARLARDSVQEEAARAEQGGAEATRMPQPAKGSWWTRLPLADHQQRHAAEQLTADALESAPKVGVQVLRLDLTPLPSVTGTPYRGTSVHAELRGAYPDVKRWLAELLARRPDALALKSIDIRRAANNTAAGVEASIELRLFERVAQGAGR